MKISRQADAVRHLFMELESVAKQIGACCFCGERLPTMKFAHRGHLKGNHKNGCPFEELAIAGEECIKLRNDSDEEAKQAAEHELSAKISALFSAMTQEAVPRCPFPVCQYPWDRHRLECPFHAFKRDAGFNG